MKRYEFKVIVLGVHNGNVVLDVMTDRKYKDWENKTSEEQQSILENRLKSKSIRSNSCRFPEVDYRNVFRMKSTDRIVPGEIKYLCLDSKEKEN